MPVVSGWANETDNVFNWYGRREEEALERTVPLMSQYVLRRLLIAVPACSALSLVLFTVLALAPGDPFSELATNPNVPPEVALALRRQVRAR